MCCFCARQQARAVPVPVSKEAWAAAQKATGCGREGMSITAEQLHQQQALKKGQSCCQLRVTCTRMPCNMQPLQMTWQVYTRIWELQWHSLQLLRTQLLGFSCSCSPCNTSARPTSKVRAALQPEAKVSWSSSFGSLHTTALLAAVFHSMVAPSASCLNC
jgi:hypothetical protein